MARLLLVAIAARASAPAPHEDATSPPAKLASVSVAYSGTVVVHPVGTIEARIGECALHVGDEVELVAQAMDAPHGELAASAVDGHVVLHDVPAGSFAIWYGKDRVAVDVVAGQTTTVTCP